MTEPKMGMNIPADVIPHDKVFDLPKAEQVVMVQSVVRRLRCCSCGASCRGRQWHNRDTGYGLCRDCSKWISTRQSPAEMHSNYGEPGVHYNVEEP